MPRKAIGGSPAPVSCSAGGAKKATKKSKAMKGGFELAGPTAAGLLLLAEEVARRYTKTVRKARVGRKVRGGGSEDYSPTERKTKDDKPIWEDASGSEFIQEYDEDGEVRFEPVPSATASEIDAHPLNIDDDGGDGDENGEQVPIPDVLPSSADDIPAPSENQPAFVIIGDTIQRCLQNPESGAYDEGMCEQTISIEEVEKMMALLEGVRAKLTAQAGGRKKKRATKKLVAKKKRVVRGGGDETGGAPFAKYFGMDSIASRMGSKMGDLTKGLNDIIAGAPALKQEQPALKQEQPALKQEQPALELEGGGKKKRAAAKKPTKKQSGGDSCYAHFGPDHSQFGVPGADAAKDAATFTATGGGKGKKKGKKQSGGDFAAIAGALYK